MIVIGGSSSTGSSLLAQMLNRHPSMVCGPETSLLARPQLHKQWDSYKRLIGKRTVRKLRNLGWHRYYGTNLDPSFYGISDTALNGIARRSVDFVGFIQSLERLVLDYHHKTLWAEKTPSNCNSFQLLLSSELDVHLILMIRNPYDSIASLINRGFSPLYATATYLVNTSMGYMDHPRVCPIKYEDLVIDSHSCLSDLFDFIGLPIHESMWQAENMNMKMDGWNNDETGQISDTSINRFDKLDWDIKKEVIALTNQIEINPKFRIIDQKPMLKDIKSICEIFGYEFIKRKASVYSKHKAEIAIEKIKRSMYRYKTGITNFPIQWTLQ